MRFRHLFVLLPILGASLLAQSPLNRPVPFVAPKAAPSPGESALTLAAADRALELGYPTVAAGLYRGLLAGPEVDRSRATLGLASALIDDGQPAEAEQALREYIGLRGAAWHLRMALASLQQGKLPQTKAEVAAVKPEDVGAADRSWYLYLQGQVVESAGDLNRAKELYQQAESAALSGLARARFVLAREQARLRLGPVTEADAEVQRRNLDQFQGRKISYGIARTYAAMLDSLGHKERAVALLQQQLATMPVEERDELDTTRLVLGLIGGAADGAGRNALGELVRDGNDRDLQRVALQLLAKASPRDPARADFRRRLDSLIGQPAAHPILEDLLLFRAVQLLADKSYGLAEDDARALLQKFPGSPLKAHALGVLTAAAWEQLRYRTAADYAAKARAELVAGPARAQLGVLVAEAWFRARDFRSAADAYAATLAEPPVGVPKGDLMFQRVLAEIETGELDRVQQVLDDMVKDPAFDAVNLWQAEWNLARALQVQGQVAAAYARVNRLLASPRTPTGQLAPELRARMAWLQASLSLEAGQAEQTLRLVDALPAAMEGIAPALRNEIASTAALLKARASFELGREAVALDLLAKLRKDFPGSDAAVYSYFVEAKHYAEQDKTVEAQQLLTKLADEFPNNTYAPYALYQAALQAERRGQESNLVEANRLIEDLVRKYGQSDLIFYARLKQGDLLRKLNQFQQAQQVYESLVNNFTTHKDVILAQLSLAECHHAQAAGDPAHGETAIVLFEHLRDRIDAPIPVRVEAGFNLGYLYSRRSAAERDRGDPARAQLDAAKAVEVWWKDVVHEFLVKDPAVADELGAKGRYWMARTLVELGMLFEQQEKLEEAKETWLLILKAKLPGEDLAKARLERFHLPAAKP